MVPTAAALHSHTSNYGVFLAVLVQNVVFWVVTPYSLVGEYQRFRDICCLHLQGPSVFIAHKGYNVKFTFSLQLTACLTVQRVTYCPTCLIPEEEQKMSKGSAVGRRTCIDWRISVLIEVPTKCS
jgi:hypothetical protein